MPQPTTLPHASAVNIKSVIFWNVAPTYCLHLQGQIDSKEASNKHVDDPEYGGSAALGNTGAFLPDYKA
jgi:hypothetical protein